MAFHEVRLDETISYGSAGGPGFNTNIIVSDSGVEHRVARWEKSRHSYDIAMAVKTPQQLADLAKFYYARLGPANGFRYKDWGDYHSNPTNPSYTSTPGTADQVIGVGTGSQTQFQLVKTYVSVPTSYVRKIEKPVEDSVRVWVNGVEQLSGWTVDITTGIITFTVAPTAGHAVAASFEFDVPVRFGKEVDQILALQFDDFGRGSARSIPLVEIKDPVPGNVGEFFYGGSAERLISANFTLSTGLGRVWRLSATTTGLAAILPDPTNIPPGAPIFYIVNKGSNAIAVKDHNGVTLVSLDEDEGVEVLLSVDSGGNKVWDVC